MREDIMPNKTGELVRDNPVGAPHIRELSLDDVRASLKDGWSDFRAHPGYGLFFGAIYMLGGLLILALLTPDRSALDDHSAGDRFSSPRPLRGCRALRGQPSPYGWENR
jgi:hypothetical protein